MELMPVKFLRAVDGDTYVLHAARFGSFEKRATVDHYRLWAYMARELHDKTSDAVRVDGKTAWQIADTALRASPLMWVTEHGLDMYGRILAEVWVLAEEHAPMQSLGQLLLSQHAVISGSAKGIRELREKEGR